jgi:hypothetical protein
MGDFVGSLLGTPPAANSIAGCLLTEKIVIISLVRDDLQGIILGARLENAVVTEPNPLIYGKDPGVFIHAPWFGSINSSSYNFPLDPGKDAKQFLATLKNLISRARYM